MNVIDKLRLKIQSLDPNATFTSTVAFFGSVVADNGINFIYAGIAVLAHLHSSKITKRKAEIEVKRMELENQKLHNEIIAEKEMKMLEAERVRKELSERV